jgi:hypothetical protein
MQVCVKVETIEIVTYICDDMLLSNNLYTCFGFNRIFPFCKTSYSNQKLP